MFIKYFVRSLQSLKNSEHSSDIKKQIASLSFLGSVLLLCVGILATVTTLAWFRDNDKVAASENGVNIETKENLIISDTEAGATNQLFVGDKTSAHLNLNSSLIAATHDSNSTKYPALLKTIKVSNVSYKTGLASSSSVTYTAAVKGKHYIEKSVYIGTAAKNYPYQSLTASISYDAQLLVDNTALRATSIDFYLVSEGTYYYKGKINLFNTENSVSILSSAGTLTTSEPLHVVMRFYFDGALTEDVSGTSKAIVRSKTINANSLALTVLFSAPHT